MVHKLVTGRRIIRIHHFLYVVKIQILEIIHHFGHADVSQALFEPYQLDHEEKILTVVLDLKELKGHKSYHVEFELSCEVMPAYRSQITLRLSHSLWNIL